MDPKAATAGRMATSRHPIPVSALLTCEYKLRLQKPRQKLRIPIPIFPIRPISTSVSAFGTRREIQLTRPQTRGRVRGSDSNQGRPFLAIVSTSDMRRPDVKRRQLRRSRLHHRRQVRLNIVSYIAVAMTCLQSSRVVWTCLFVSLLCASRRVPSEVSSCAVFAWRGSSTSSSPFGIHVRSATL